MYNTIEVINLDVLAFWFSDHIAHDVVIHTHDFHQLIYCKKGGGYITVGNERLKALTGHVYLSKPGVLHAIEMHEDMHLLEIKFIAEESITAILPDHFDISVIPAAQSMLLTAGSEGIKGEVHYDEAANCAFKLFLIHCIRHFTHGTRNKPYSHSSVLDIPEYAKENNDMKILNLKYYISDRLNEEISLSELADEVSFNKTYFVKRFKILFGMSPMKYVNSMRISRAKQLLLQTSLPISEISLKTGFKSPHYFSRSFRSSESMSPQEFREKHKK